MREIFLPKSFQRVLVFFFFLRIFCIASALIKYQAVEFDCNIYVYMAGK